ncbi:MAG: serine hydrolase domain-containing protein [Kofleriaceae bacterium]
MATAHRPIADTVHGTVAAGWEPVSATFAASLARGEEWGGSVSVWHRGRVVVDLWGGVADRATRAPWQADTITTVFSATKGLVALCFLMLADRGQLDYDAPVARWWPAFAAAGKADVTVRTLLNHRSGLVALDRPITLDDLAQRPDHVAALLAAQAPRWAPGTDQGYHAVTYGLYAGELFRRVAGESLGRFLAREVAAPLGADVHLGLAEADEVRVATNHPATTAERVLKIVPKLLFHRGVEGRVYRQVALGRDAARAFGNPRELGPTGVANFNTRRVHALELPWCNGITNGRGLARVYAALAAGGTVDGVRLVGAQAVAGLAPRQSWAERDRVLRKPLGWSQGFLKDEPHLFSPNPASFGHAGAGGALGWCDPAAQLAIGYATCKMDHRVRSRRAVALCHAIYRALA